MPGAGRLIMRFEPSDGSAPIEHEVFQFPESGCAMGMYNLDASIRGFARSCMNYGLDLGWPVFLSTKNTILKQDDGRFSYNVVECMLYAVITSSLARFVVSLHSPQVSRQNAARAGSPAHRGSGYSLRTRAKRTLVG